MTMIAETRLHELLADLDRSGRVPLYWQIAETLEAAIDSGAIAAGSRLENEHALSARLGLSSVTVKKAMARLVTKGLVVRRRGFGTIVVPQSTARKLALTSLHDDLRLAGRAPTTRVLAFERLAADPAAARRLGVPVGTGLLQLRRLRSADGQPIAVLENTLIDRFVDLDPTNLARRGLYEILRTQGTRISVARQVISARPASGSESVLLDLDAGSPVLTLQRTAFDAAGMPVEFGDHCYRTDAHSFDVTVVVP